MALHRPSSPANAIQWHAVIGDETIADAILDRLVHNAHRIKLGGPSLCVSRKMG